MYFTNLDDHLLDVEFDLNPLKREEDKQNVDQRIRLRLLPVQVVYDAVSSIIHSSSQDIESYSFDDLYLSCAIICRTQ